MYSYQSEIFKRIIWSAAHEKDWIQYLKLISKVSFGVSSVKKLIILSNSHIYCNWLASFLFIWNIQFLRNSKQVLVTVFFNSCLSTLFEDSSNFFLFSNRIVLQMVDLFTDSTTEAYAACYNLTSRHSLWKIWRHLP